MIKRIIELKESQTATIEGGKIIISDKKPELFQGFTMAQWRYIVEGGFYMEVSDEPEFVASNNLRLLSGVLEESQYQFRINSYQGYKYARIPKTRGIRKPWFGGVCPTDGFVVVKLRNGKYTLKKADEFDWQHRKLGFDIVEYMEL